MRLASLALAAAILAASAFFPGSGPLAGQRLPPRLQPEIKLQPRPRGDPPMRIVRVTGADPACEPNCPEWISAEGTIMPGTGAAFAKAIADLGGRRLPVLISSHGGSLADAVAMGRLIRERGLAVAVARTLIADCPQRARTCPDAKGRAIAGGAFCASACPLILAGGVERLVGPVPLVGVHQITSIKKETEGAEHLTRVRKVYEAIGADEAVQSYLASMGVGDPVMSLLRKTPASSIRWLSLKEIRASRLATLALDASAPILTSGANGLNGRVFDGDAGGAVTARWASGAVAASLAYRPGGGAVELALAGRDATARKALAWTLAIGGSPLTVKADPAGGGRATIPRERLCAVVPGGKLVVTADGSSEPTAFDVAAMDGAKALIDQACP